VALVAAEPVGGPAWKTDFVEGQRIALREGRPLVVVFMVGSTGCEILKRELQDAKVRPRLNKAVCVHLDFSSQRPREPEAAWRRDQRIEMRFPKPGYPSVFLVDPATLKVLHSTVRLQDSMLEAIDRAEIAADPSAKAADELEAADRRAEEFQIKPTTKLAQINLRDTDVVIASLAISYLAKNEPGLVADDAVALLEVPHFRIDVCRALIQHPSPAARGALVGIVKKSDSHVLRCVAVEALGECADEVDIDLISPLLPDGRTIRLGDKMYTSAAQALAQIGRRHPESRVRVCRLLFNSFPIAETGDRDNGNLPIRFYALTVHNALRELTNRQIEFSGDYTFRRRRALLETWSKELDDFGREKTDGR
jgi:hypothetical protein